VGEAPRPMSGRASEVQRGRRAGITSARRRPCTAQARVAPVSWLAVAVALTSDSRGTAYAGLRH
jgi:hypothetical protein